MQMQGKYRHELKYSIGKADYLAIRARVKAVMKRDPHTDENGLYTIRSIYFDNPDDKALREKIDGVAKREKFRIRYYNDDFSFITLEKKMKNNNLCMKLDANITEKECKAILHGDTAWMKHHENELIRELYCKMNHEQLRPRVLVSYVREPYVYEAGNVRVTFDSHIRTSLFHQSFLEQNVYDISATDNPEDMILEVKFDEYLPDIISCLIQTQGVRMKAFSKYGACRRFG